MSELSFDGSWSDPNESKTNGQRSRNTLTLVDRVNAIRAYDRNPMYTRVAKQFNCCWEQIRNIVANRDIILKRYAEIQNLKKQRKLSHFGDSATIPAPIHVPNAAPVAHVRTPAHPNVDFLNVCLHEYLLRVHFHKRIVISADFIRANAVHFAKRLECVGFAPNKLWLYDFARRFKLTLPLKHMHITERPLNRMDLPSIIAYCSLKRQSLNAPKARAAQPAPNIVSTKKRLHHISAHKLQMQRQHALRASSSTMIPKDSQRIHEFQLKQNRVITLEQALYEYIQRARAQQVELNDQLLMRVAGELCSLLLLENFTPTQSWLEHYKSRYDFSVLPAQPLNNMSPIKSLELIDILNYCSKHENTNHTLASLQLQPVRAMKRSQQQAITPPSSEVICILDDDDDDRHDKTADTQSDMHDATLPSTKSPATDVNANNIVPPSAGAASPTGSPPLKVRRLENLLSPRVLKNLENTAPQAKPMPSTAVTATQCPVKTAAMLLSTNADVLQYLKPLEEFAMLRDNYRVIGILSQLEQILKDTA